MTKKCKTKCRKNTKHDKHKYSTTLRVCWKDFQNGSVWECVWKHVVKHGANLIYYKKDQTSFYLHFLGHSLFTNCNCQQNIPLQKTVGFPGGPIQFFYNLNSFLGPSKNAYKSICLLQKPGYTPM